MKLANAVEIAPGCLFLPDFLGRAEQQALVAALRAIVDQAPFFVPRMPRTGKPFSVRMTNCGPLGWVSDKDNGYRYQATHPDSGAAWPQMPQMLLNAWQALAAYPQPPQACLINHYGSGAKMGLHRDEDEQDFDAPVVSLSLGDTAMFRIGGITRKAATRSIRLASGDAIVLGGESRLAYHGVDRILPGTSTLLGDWPAPDDRHDGNGRINLTLRRVTPPEA